MGSDPTQKSAAPARAGAGPTERSPAIARDRRVDRTEDMTEDEIAAAEASEMAPGLGRVP